MHEMAEAPRTHTFALKLRDAMPVRTMVATVLGAGGQRWEGEQGTVGSATGNDLVVADETVSGCHARLTASNRGIVVEDFGSTNGTLVNGVRIERAIVQPRSVLTLGRKQVEVLGGRPATVELHDEDRLGDLRGRTPSMRRLMRDLRRVAPGTASVLLIGESGTGKELLARAVHDGSPRAANRFVTVDCGSLTPSLVASELFGHEQGAFTGANRTKVGAFEHADGGTLFLDEIGELPSELQSSLLGALERNRFTRVGGRAEIEVDVRVVAATNRDLRSDVNAGSFRLDLYYRLAVVTLEVPPLRDRAADIPLLLEHFIREEGLTGPVDAVVPEETLQMLKRHRWPGNVRELKNFVRATIALGEPVAIRDDPPSGAESARSAHYALLSKLPYGEARSALLGEFEAVYVKSLLERTQGNVARAAREGEMARSHLNELLRRHNLRGNV